MIPSNLLEKFHLLGDSPEVIQQLRKLIIVLAIGGKLAPENNQNFNAKVILEQILEKRKVLFKNKQLRNQQSPEILPEELPDGLWADVCHFVRLGFIAQVEKGPTGIQKAIPGDYPLVATAEDRLTCDHYDFDGSAAIVPLVSSAGHGKASLNRLHYQEGKFALGSILAAIFPLNPELVSARFLFEYLTAFKDELLVSKMTGTANVTLTIGRLCDVPVPLISSVVQRRIDELMALCDQLQAAQTEREQSRDRLVAASLHSLNPPADDVVANTPEIQREHARFLFNHLPRLTTRPAHIKQLRQTILNLAVRGKLVPQDRNDEPVAGLLELCDKNRREKAKEDRRADVEQQILLASEDRWDVPGSWAWRALADIVLFIDYRGKTPVKTSEGVRLITAKNVKQGYINLSPEEFLSNADYETWMSRGYPALGDILFTTEAPMGNAAVVRLVEDFALAQRVICFRPYTQLNSDFLVLQLLAEPFQSILDKTATGLTAKGIKAAKLKRLPIAIPPLAEQHRIVAKVDELMALCDQLETQLASTATDSRRLLEAVLHDALLPADVAA